MVYICGICQDDMEATGTVALPCGHTFDLNCIQTWIDINPVCPICRAFTSREDIITLFIQFSEDSLVQADGEKLPRAVYEKILNELRDDISGEVEPWDKFLQPVFKKLIHLINQIDNIQVESERLNKKCQELGELHKGDIERYENQVHLIISEKEEMRKLLADEVTDLQHQVDNLKLKNEELSSQNESHINEKTGLKDQLKSIKSEQNELVTKYQKRIEEFLDTEIKYRELTGDYYRLKESSQQKDPNRVVAQRNSNMGCRPHSNYKR